MKLRLAWILAGIWPALAQTTGPTANPTSVNFTYQVKSTSFPASAKVTVSLPTAMASLPMNVVVASAPQGWLTATPDTGRSPLVLTVSANPTSLSPGSYYGTITINTTPANATPAVVGVTLSISNPPSTIVVSSPSSNYSPPTSSAGPTLSFGFTTGSAAPTPPSAEIDVASTGDVIPFNVTAGYTGKATTGAAPVWLRVNLSGQLPNTATSGVALSGSSVPITVSLDMATLSALDPGSYTQTVTIAANNTINGSAAVTVNLVVSAGPPTLRISYPIFPPSVVAGPTIDPVITIYGDNFFSTSVVSMQLGSNQPVTLTSKLLSRKVLQATIKAAYLAVPTDPTTYPILWSIAVTNPAPPTNPGQLPATTTFFVTDPTQPGIVSVVNSASFLPTAVQTGTGANPVSPGATSLSPRQIISIFGQNLGPANVTPTTPAGSPLAYPTNAGGVQVAFKFGSPAQTVYAPILMTSGNQINCIVPVEVGTAIGSANTTAAVAVINGASPTPDFPVTVVAQDPGVFTFGGLGQGQAAVLNIDSSTGSYTINSTKTAAPRGSTIAIYAAGLGDLASPPNLANGEVTSSAVTVASDTCRVDIDGQPAVVSYCGTSPGAVAGLVQINAVIPPTIKTGAAISMTVSAGSAATSRRSQPGVTLAVK